MEVWSYLLTRMRKGYFMTSIQAEDEWLSLSEAAELLGMHPATVRLWASLPPL